MFSYFEMDSLVCDTRDSAAWLWFLLWLLSTTSIIYCWLTGTDLLATISAAAFAAVMQCAPTALVAVRNDTSAEADSAPPNSLPADVSADLQQPVSAPAYIPRHVSPPLPARWAWERPGGLREFSERKIWSTESWYMSWQLEDDIHAFMDKHLAHRKQRRLDAAKKAAAPPPPAATVKEIRPAPPAKPKRAFLSEPEGYTQAYTKFNSTFGHTHVSNEFVLENEAGQYITSISEITPPERYNPLPAIEELATSLGIKGSGQNCWISAPTNATTGTAPMNGAPAHTIPIVRVEEPATGYSGPFSAITTPPAGTATMNGAPAPTTSFVRTDAPSATEPTNGSADLFNLRSTAPPAAPMQPTTTTSGIISSGGDVPTPGPPAAPALRFPAPPAAPTQPATTTPLPAPAGGDTALPAGPPPALLTTPTPTPAPMQPTSGSTGGSSVFGDATSAPSSGNPLFSMSPSHAQSEVDIYLTDIYGKIQEIRTAAQGSSLGTAWNSLLGSGSGRSEMAALKKKLKNITDWAKGPNGRADEQKLPRSLWQQYGLDKQDVDAFVRFLELSKPKAINPGQGNNIAGWIGLAKKRRHMFE